MGSNKSVEIVLKKRSKQSAQSKKRKRSKRKKEKFGNSPVPSGYLKRRRDQRRNRTNKNKKRSRSNSIIHRQNHRNRRHGMIESDDEFMYESDGEFYFGISSGMDSENDTFHY